MTGNEHSSFNAAIVRACGDIAHKAELELHFFGEKSHCGAILDGLQEDCRFDVLSQEIAVVPGKKRHFIRKVTLEVYNLVKILCKARKGGASVLILSTSAPTMVILFAMQYAFRSVPTHLILHGLDGLLRRDKWKVTSYGLWNRLALLHFYNGRWPLTYVLGEGIRSRLLDNFPNCFALQTVRVIEHPFDFGPPVAPPLVGEQSAAGDRPMCVGFLGYGRRDKGIDKFYLLAERMSDLVLSGAVKFVIAGTLNVDCGQYRNRWVEELHTDPLFVTTPEQYQEEVRGLDCAVFLYDSSNCLTASGSIFDAVAAGVKIVSLPNPYITDIQVEDVEGGITIVAQMEDMEQYLRNYLLQGEFRRRFAFGKVRAGHGREGLVKAIITGVVV
jgi:glycosyltransferase involved in cell wall biosynthesis